MHEHCAAGEVLAGVDQLIADGRTASGRAGASKLTRHPSGPAFQALPGTRQKGALVLEGVEVQLDQALQAVTTCLRTVTVVEELVHVTDQVPIA